MIGKLSYKYINLKCQNTVLFLHGWGCNKNYMSALSESKKYNSLIIDLPGFGENKKLDFPYKIDDFIEEIIMFLCESNHKITHIVGHSFGGKLSCRLANLLKVKGLIKI